MTMAQLNPRHSGKKNERKTTQYLEILEKVFKKCKMYRDSNYKWLLNC